jgi:hypothetical protein
LRQYLRVPEDPPESAADRAARLNEGGVVLTWCAGQWAWVWNSTPVTTHHLRGVERLPSGGGALGDEDPLVTLVEDGPVDHAAAQAAFEPFSGRPLDADQIAECLAVNFNGVLVRPWPRARLEGDPFNRLSTKRESLLEACVRLIAAAPMTFTSWDHFVGTVTKTASRITKESTRIGPLDEAVVAVRIVERHEDNLVDQPARRLTTFECPNVHRALPSGYAVPALEIPRSLEARVKWSSPVRPVETRGIAGAWLPALVAERSGLKLKLKLKTGGHRGRVPSGWVSRCGTIDPVTGKWRGTALRFNGRHAVACPSCGLGIPRGADVALSQASIDRRDPGSPSRVVLGTTLPASPIWDAPWAGDDDDNAEGRYALASKGERLQEIFAADPDSEELSERLRRVLVRTLGFLLAELGAVEADRDELYAVEREFAPRRANRRDRAGLEFQAMVRAERQAWLYWSDGEDPAEAEPPTRTEYRLTDPAARALQERIHQAWGPLGQGWGAWHALANKLKILQQKQIL